ncbi:hypothetical protein CEXT_511021 [Caerostris extrusa]|uniref:Kinesin family member 24 n=1 Tax=Caerostris extrusa TaxID=172846 RepID=A0AAV4XKE8_CAEEX|nr:hypothetical protein CEXT_511021 [Caerostris extrusa]
MGKHCFSSSKASPNVEKKSRPHALPAITPKPALTRESKSGGIGRSGSLGHCATGQGHAPAPTPLRQENFPLLNSFSEKGGPHAKNRSDLHGTVLSGQTYLKPTAAF